MRNILKSVAVFMLIGAVAVTGFAATSPVKPSTDTGSSGSGSSSGGGGGGGTVAAATITTASASSLITGTQDPTTAENPSNGGSTVDGAWSYNNGTWTCAVGGSNLTSQWKSVTNPYAGNAAQWFYFDVTGRMVTGWQWIKGADGKYHCYYFNPVSNGSQGQCQLGGTTPDGWQVNENGEWVVEGVVQTR